MLILDDEEDTEIVTLALPLDRRTISWLAKISRNDSDAGEKVASMLREIRLDDEAAHRILN